MEIKISTHHVLKVLQILSWIIFIGLSIETGAILFNLIYTFAINPANTHSFWGGADLSGLYQHDHGHFMVVILLMLIVSMLKATMFYLIVMLFVNKKLDLSQPFTDPLRKFILNIAYLTFGIAFFCQMGSNYVAWLAKQDIGMPSTQLLQVYGADIWLFMAVTLLVIAQVVKKGIEIQNENDLTI